jgi:HSP20 family protein
MNMNLIKWSPWHEMPSLQHRINRFLEDAWAGAPTRGEDFSLAEWNPAVDIYEDADTIVIKAELPGVDKQDIAVDLKDDVLSLRGERNYQNEVKEDHYYRKERASGSFSRRFTLPAGMNPETIKADYQDGVLTVTIPKPEERKPKQITVH